MGFSLIYNLEVNRRMLRRDGGTDSGGWFGDGGSCYGGLSVLNSCESFCRVRTDFNLMGCIHNGSWPQYMKCYDSNSIEPLNGLRVAFPSQTGTTDIDPIIPQMPIGNSSFCMRINQIVI